MEKKLATYVILGVIVWAILGTFVGAYYYVQYITYRNEYNYLTDQLDAISIKANIVINYGNGTKVWYNNTVLPLGSTAFIAINITVNTVEYTDYGGDLGILVTSINGVANDGPYGWFYCYWNHEEFEWKFPDHSSSRHILHDGDVVAFTYDSYPPKPPI